MSKIRKLGLLLFVGVLSTFLVLAGCGSAKDEKESAGKRTIVYGGSSWMAHIPAYIGVKKGFFKEQGLDVEFKSFPTSSARMSALATGDVDFGSTGVISAISLMAQGDDSFSIFGVPDIYVGQEGIVAHEEIKSIKDLKGKKVAVPFSSSSHVMLIDLLKQNGLNPQKDVQVINMDGDKMVPAFTNKQIHAAAIWSPSYQKLQQVKGAHVLADDTKTSIYKQFKFNAGPDVLVINNKFAEENPETTKKLLAGYFKSIQFLKENPQEAAKIFKELSNLDEKEQMKIIEDINWIEQEKQKELLGSEGDFSKTLVHLSQFLSENKLINAKVDVKEWMNTDVLP